MKDESVLILEGILNRLKNMSMEETIKMFDEMDKVVEYNRVIFESDKYEIDFELDIDEVDTMKNKGRC